MAEKDTSERISLTSIFFAFFRIGTFAFGGVYSMLAFFEKELVEKKKWLTHDEYLENVAIGQMTPGAPIINTGISIGYRLRQMRGAVTATAGQILTGTIIAVLLALFYTKTREHPMLQPVMKGVGAAVVGFLLSIIFTMGKKTFRDFKTVLIALAGFICLALLKLNPIFIIVAGCIAGFILFRGKPS